VGTFHPKVLLKCPFSEYFYNQILNGRHKKHKIHFHESHKRFTRGILPLKGRNVKKFVLNNIQLFLPQYFSPQLLSSAKTRLFIKDKKS